MDKYLSTYHIDEHAQPVEEHSVCILLSVYIMIQALDVGTPMQSMQHVHHSASMRTHKVMT